MWRNLCFILAISSVMLGCSAYTVALDPRKVEASPRYQHVTINLNVPYSEAVRNFKLGYNKCAINNNQSSVTSATGSTSFVGGKWRHFLNEPSSSEMEFQLRADGFINILVTLTENGSDGTKLSFHGPNENWASRFANLQTNPEPFVKWAQGNNSYCHGYRGQK